MADESKGQHFLINDHDLDSIVDAADIRSGELVIEVGPGLGSLTTRLAERAARVLCVEIDRKFQPILNPLTRVYKNLVVEYDDILKIPFDELRSKGGISKNKDYSIVANIPYYLTSKLIPRVLSYHYLPRTVVFLMQKEVAERICATDGKQSKLSLAVQFYARPTIVLSVPKEHFFPIPKVNSSLLVLTDIRRWSFSEDEAFVWRLIRIGFSSKRKKLLNNIMAGLHRERRSVERCFLSAHIDINTRAEALSLAEWRALSRSISSIHTP